MRYLIFSVFALTFLVGLAANATAEPEIYSVAVQPDQIDNEVEEDVFFEADCSVCEEGMSYFFWNSSLDGVLGEGSEGHSISLVSTSFSHGDHTISFKVQDDQGEWSTDSDISQTTLTVSGRGGESSLEANFEIFPAFVHVGETTTFRACTLMIPAQPCYEGDDDPEIIFDWKLQLENEQDWSSIGDQESFDYADFVIGTHKIELTVSYGEEEASSIKDLTVMPPIPLAIISYQSNSDIKEGEILNLTARCLDNEQAEIECDYFWQVWDTDSNPDLLFELTGSFISVTNLTNEIGSYEFLLRTKDKEFGILSIDTKVIVNVLPPNTNPTPIIDITPESLGGLTPQYYQYAMLAFNGSSSEDQDGNIVSYKWSISNSTSTWSPPNSELSEIITSFSLVGNYQIRLEVEDDSGAWSSVSTNFKIIPNTAPTVVFDYSNEGSTYTFNSSSSDSEGFISSYEWSINGITYSNEANITWSPNKTGIYIINLMVIDDGGMNSSFSKNINFAMSEIKNFTVFFSSTDIEVGGKFDMDFSQTTGDFEYFDIKVLYPNGTSTKYTVTDKSVNFSLTFDKSGKYPIDVKVIWMDGVDRGLDDFEGPTVNVGQGGSSSGGGSETEELPTDSSDALPSVSLLVSIFLLSMIAVSRRQR